MALAVMAAAAVVAQPTIANYPLGATIVPAAEGGGVVFRVWAPNATTVRVAGQFNGWNQNAATATMTRDAGGNWSNWVPTATQGQEYRFVIDSLTPWRVDPRARDVVNSDGNGVIRGNGSSYPWQATAWQTPDIEAMVIYELHVGSFSGNGDGGANYPGRFRDVVDLHLDDLLALNVNMVELMPIHEFSGGISWGYNPSHFFAPESDYGTPDDLRYLVDTLQQNGIGVILDVVWNHASFSDNNLWQFDGPENIYFYSTGNACADDTPWGSRPDYSRVEVRDFIADNARYWLSEFRMDGYRVDFTRAMRGYCGENGDGWAVLNNIVDVSKAVNPRAIVIAEDLPNDGSMTTPQSQGGAGFDAQWGDPFHDVMRAQLSLADPNMNAIAGVIADSGFGRPAREAVKYIDSHDEAGNDQRITRAIDPANPFSARAQGLKKVGAAMTLLSPGIPMLLQGQEFMEDKPFGDQQNERIWWGFLDTYSGIRDFHGRLALLRRTRPSLRASAGIQFIQVNDAANVVAFQRFDGAGDMTLVVANFGATNFNSYLIGAPAEGQWYELAASDSVAHNGTGVTNGHVVASTTDRDGQPGTLDLKLPPYSVQVFSRAPLPGAAHPDVWVIE